MKAGNRLYWPARPETVPASGKAASKVKARKPRRSKPFFNFRLMDFFDVGTRKMAKCLGMTHRMLFDSVLRNWRSEAEAALGFDVVKAQHLTPAQIRKLRARFELVRMGIRKGGNAHRN